MKKICTLNIRLDVSSDGKYCFDGRKDGIKNFLLTENFNIVGFQETLPHQYSFLTGILSEYDSVNTPREEGNFGESCPIFFKKSEYELIEDKTFWLNEDGTKYKKGWDAACVRICTHAKIREKSTNHIVNIFNVHFDHLGDIARINSSKIIKDRVIECGDELCILFGDFNIESNHPAFKELLSGKLLNNTLDLAKELVEHPYTFHGYDTENEDTNLYIDYIFTNKDISVLKHEVHSGEIISDHYAVSITLE